MRSIQKQKNKLKFMKVSCDIRNSESIYKSMYSMKIIPYNKITNALKN